MKILFKIKVKNDCEVDITGLDGLMTLRDAKGTDLDVVTVDLSGNAYAGKEGTWTLTLRVDPNYEYADALWYSTYEELEIAFKITEASFADYTYKEYTDSKEIIIKESDGGVGGLEKTENSYQQAVSLYEQGRYEEAKPLFESLNNYKDSISYYNWCCEQIEIAELDAVYEQAMSLYAQEKYGEAISALNEIYWHKDSAEKIEEIENAVYAKVETLTESGNYTDARSLLFQIDVDTSSSLYKAYSYAAEGDFGRAVEYGLTVVVFPDGTESIADNAFKTEYGNDLKKVVLPSTVKTIGESAFYGCQSLEEINLPDGLLTIGKAAFQSCVKLKKVELPEGILAISDNTFYNCAALGKIELPASLINIGKSAFSRCALREISWPDNLQTIGNNAFSHCDLTTLQLPDSLRTLGTSAFSSCSELITVSVPGGVKNIAENAFDYCVKLTQVTLAEGVEAIEGCAFNDCYELTTVSLPYSLKKIYGSAFYDCATLSEITIPAQVNFIGSYAFYGCSLKNVYFDNTEGWTQSGVITLNVSDPQKNAQKLTSADVTNWSRSE